MSLTSKQFFDCDELPIGFNVAITAAGTGDNTKVNGATLDTLGYLDAVVVLNWKTTLASSETLSFALELQESDDGSTWDTAEVVQALTAVETGAQTASYGSKEYLVDLQGRDKARKRYIRFNVTPDLSASGTDTVNAAGSVRLGAKQVAAPKTNPTLHV